jgi:hypothetical protein
MHVIDREKGGVVGKLIAHGVLQRSHYEQMKNKLSAPGFFLFSDRRCGSWLTQLLLIRLAYTQ